MRVGQAVTTTGGIFGSGGLRAFNSPCAWSFDRLQTAGHVESSDIQSMQQAGWSELQIAETIHLTALFARFDHVLSGFGLPSAELLATVADPSPEACAETRNGTINRDGVTA